MKPDLQSSISKKNASELKAALESVSQAEKGPAFEQVLAELYRGNGWIISVQGGRGDDGADILLSHPRTPLTVSLILQAKNHAKPLTLDQTRIELIKFEKQAAPRHKCQQFRLVAVNGFVEEARKLSQFNLLLDTWDHVAHLLKSYDPKKHTEPEIELFAHNQKAYEKVQELWQENNKVAVVQATGTGKSFVIAKVLSDFHAKQKIVLAPSHYILDQQKSKAPWLNDRTIYQTYAGLARRSAEEIEAFKCSCIVLDEFHRCGADIWGQGVQRLLESHPKSKILGTSATPIRYLDESRDMSEELFDGVMAVELPLAEAIVKRILPAPTYISALYTLNEEIRNILDEVNASKRSEEEKTKLREEIESVQVDWEKTTGVPEILKKYLDPKINKLIVFCKDQEHLDEMEIEVLSWFQKAGTHRWREKYRVLSADPESKKNLEQFKAAERTDTVHLLFAIDMLNEGLHIPEVGAVILLRPTESPTIFYQQIGRCIEVGKDQPPIIFDLVNNFQNVRANDFLADLDEAAKNEDKLRAGLGLESNTPSIRIEELSQQIAEILGSIHERVISWEVQFDALRIFKEKHGHCIVPHRYAEKPALGVWVQNQRSIKNRGRMSTDRIRQLEGIGFVWDPLEAAWEEMYEVLHTFKEKYGHCNVPRKPIGNSPFEMWVSTQRRTKRSGWLSVDHIRRLDDLGFVWNPQEAVWEEMYEALRIFKEKHGHCNLPYKYPENLTLWNWANTQRSIKKSGRQSADRIRRLEDLGFVWNLPEAAWEEMYETLRTFKEKHGHGSVSLQDAENSIFGRWVKTQRKTKRSGQLSADRIRRLEHLGFVWDQLESAWEEMYEALSTFKEKHGHCNVPWQYSENPSLGRWVNTQRKTKRSGLLSADRMRRLEKIEFAWEPYEAAWEEMYEALHTFKRKHGHCNLPWPYPENPILRNWVNTQRSYRKSGSLSADRIRRLDELGFEWTRRRKSISKAE